MLVCSNAGADVYKQIAGNGLITYTNKPRTDNGYHLLFRTPPRSYPQDLKFVSQNKQKYSDLVAKAAAKHNLDVKLLHAVIQAESAYNANAESPAGAVGLMQLMPDTAVRYGVADRRDAEQNIDGGARYLKDLLAMFNSDLKLAVAGYNAGEGAVMKYHYNIPPYPETMHYVEHVLSLYAKG